MQNKPKISVIIPVYKTQENHFRKSVNSVLEQSLQDFEIILVTDGPKICDKICEEYAEKDCRIKIIYNIKKGLGGARNAGMKISQGDYICFLDSDDWLDKDALLKTYPLAKENDLDLLFFETYNFDEKTEKISPFNGFVSLPKELEYKVFTYKDILLTNNLLRVSHTAWSKLFKKDFLLDNNLFFADKCFFEDFEFFFRYIFKMTKLGYINSALYFYRINVENSMVADANKNHFDLLTVLDSVKNSLIENNLFKDYEILFNNYKIVNLEFRYNNVDDKYKKEFKKRIKDDFRKMGLSKQDLKKLSPYARQIYEEFTGAKFYLLFLPFRKAYRYYIIYF